MRTVWACALCWPKFLKNVIEKNEKLHDTNVKRITDLNQKNMKRFADQIKAIDQQIAELKKKISWVNPGKDLAL